jgi:hypothetical protein
MSTTGREGARTPVPKTRLESGSFLVKDAARDAVISSEQRIMAIGASWSLMTVQGAGTANFGNMDALSTDLVAAGNSANWLPAVQWEFRAARPPEAVLRRLHVCCPRLIQPKHIVNPRGVLAAILLATAGPLSVLKENLEMLWLRSGIDPGEFEGEPEDRLRARLSAHFSGLPAEWWRGLVGQIDLENLTRFVRGREWTETRRFPGRDTTVESDQDRRLSVFTLEALLPRDQLLRTDYISTSTVIDYAIDQASRERFIPDYIFLYCHEVHALRARRQILEKIWCHAALASEPGWLLRPECVIYRGGSDSWDWPDNAQDWTQSLEAWMAYNGAEAAQ